MKSQLQLRKKASLQNQADGNLLQMTDNLSSSKPEKDDFDNVQSRDGDFNITSVNNSEPISAMDEGRQVADGLQVAAPIQSHYDIEADDTKCPVVIKDVLRTNDFTTKADDVFYDDATSCTQTTSFHGAVPDCGVVPQSEDQGTVINGL